MLDEKNASLNYDEIDGALAFVIQKVSCEVNLDSFLKSPVFTVP